MNNSPGFLDSIFNSGFDVKLFLLVILLSIWLGASLKNMNRSSKFMHVLGDTLIGLLVGVVLGMSWNANYHAGIFTLGGLALGITLILNAEPAYRWARVFAVIAAFSMALFMYYSQWGSFGYLMDSLLEDFQGGF